METTFSEFQVSGNTDTVFTLNEQLLQGDCDNLCKM